MSRYEDGKAYRRNLGNRPRETSTPDAGPAHLASYPRTFPVTRHTAKASEHKETVGWMNGEFHDATHPNTGAHGASGSSKDSREFHENSFDKEPQRRGKAKGFNT